MTINVELINRLRDLNIAVDKIATSSTEPKILETTSRVKVILNEITNKRNEKEILKKLKPIKDELEKDQSNPLKDLIDNFCNYFEQIEYNKANPIRRLRVTLQRDLAVNLINEIEQNFSAINQGFNDKGIDFEIDVASIEDARKLKQKLDLWLTGKSLKSLRYSYGVNRGFDPLDDKLETEPVLAAAMLDD